MSIGPASRPTSIVQTSQILYSTQRSQRKPQAPTSQANAPTWRARPILDFHRSQLPLAKADLSKSRAAIGPCAHTANGSAKSRSSLLLRVRVESRRRLVPRPRAANGCAENAEVPPCLDLPCFVCILPMVLTLFAGSQQKLYHA